MAEIEHLLKVLWSSNSIPCCMATTFNLTRGIKETYIVYNKETWIIYVNQA